MRISLIVAAVMLPASAFAAIDMPDWAFPNQANSPQPPKDATAAAAPAAPAAEGTRMPADPNAPAIVRDGKGKDVRACDGCHFVTGLGEPESAGLAGLPSAYFAQTMDDFKTGVRKGVRANNMIAFAKVLTPEDNKAIADYYASLKPKPWTHVIEAATVPKTYIGQANGRRLWPDGGDEPLGARIIEYPADFATLRAPDNKGYAAYVPVGSVAKGEALVKTGGGKATPCGVCHGAAWTGKGDVPGIAGRSPVYIARQIYMYQAGDRAGPNGDIMKGVVGKLSDDDIIAVSAYLASRPPGLRPGLDAAF